MFTKFCTALTVPFEKSSSVSLPYSDANISGHAYNACAYSRIFKEITIDMVKAAYTLRDSSKHGFYYKVLTPG